MLLLRQVRDEAHRFALAYHQKKRTKSAFGRKQQPAKTSATTNRRGAARANNNNNNNKEAYAEYDDDDDDDDGDGEYGLRDDDPEMVALGAVKGLTRPKRRALLLELGPIADIAAASDARLRAVTGIGPTLSARLRDHFATQTDLLEAGETTAAAAATASAVAEAYTNSSSVTAFNSAAEMELEEDDGGLLFQQQVIEK